MFLKALAAHREHLDITVYGPRVDHAFFDVSGLGYRCHASSAGSVARWHMWEQFEWPRIAEGLLVNPINTGPVLARKNRQVIFAHDLNVVRFPRNYSWKFRLWYSFASLLAMKQALHLVCFSSHVKEDLIERLGVKPDKVTVLPQGPGLPIAPDLAPVEQKDPYFLCVGGMQPHKNLAGCLIAWRDSGLAGKGYTLRVVGKPQANYAPLGIGPDLLQQPGVVFTGYLDDSALIENYRRCRAFVYPSFEEGFGLPVVEAFYAGAPVITSNCSCLPEVAGEAAILIDPHQPRKLADAMSRVANDAAMQKHLMSAGLCRRKQFTWEKAGARMADLLVGLAGTEGGVGK